MSPHPKTTSTRLESRSTPLDLTPRSLSAAPRRCGASRLLVSRSLVLRGRSGFNSGHCSNVLHFTWYCPWGYQNLSYSCRIHVAAQALIYFSSIAIHYIECCMYSWEHGQVQVKPKDKGKVSYLLGMAPKLSAGDFSPTILVLKYMRCSYLRNYEAKS